MPIPSEHRSQIEDRLEKQTRSSRWPGHPNIRVNLMTRARNGPLHVVGRMPVCLLDILLVQVATRIYQRQRTILCEGTNLIEYFGFLLGGASISSGSRKVLLKSTLDTLMLFFSKLVLSCSGLIFRQKWLENFKCDSKQPSFLSFVFPP